MRAARSQRGDIMTGLLGIMEVVVLVIRDWDCVSLSVWLRIWGWACGYYGGYFGWLLIVQILTLAMTSARAIIWGLCPLRFTAVALSV